MLAAPNRYAPAMLAGVHVDGDDASEWRLEQRQLAWSRQVTEFPNVVVRRLGWFGLADGNQEGQAVGPDVQHAGLGVDCRAGPIRAAGNARNLDCAALRRGRVQWAVVVLRDDVQRLLAQFRLQIDQVVLAHTLKVDRCRPGRKRLRLRCALTGDVGGRYRSIFDRPHRLAGYAIEDIYKGLLGDLGHCLDAPSVYCDVDQIGRCWRVVVPQSMSDELVVPYLLAGCRLDAHEAVAIETVSRAMPAVVVVGWRADWEVDVAEFLIRTHRRPNVGVAGFL